MLTDSTESIPCENQLRLGIDSLEGGERTRERSRLKIPFMGLGRLDFILGSYLFPGIDFFLP